MTVIVLDTNIKGNSITRILYYLMAIIVTDTNIKCNTSGLIVAQSVKCLATDASLIADPGVVSLITAWSHTFMEIDNKIISMVILLPSAESFKKSCR